MVKRIERALAAAVCVLAACASADTVWLDEPGVWDRMRGGRGRSWALTNETTMVGGTCSRGVGTCAPCALYVAVDGNARSFSATVGQLERRNASKLTVRVWRENELAFESQVLDRDSGPVEVKVDLSGARWVKLELFGIDRATAGRTVWGDAKFEMKPGTRPHDLGDLTRQLGILTPPPAKAPRINAPRRFGVRPTHPLLFRVPVVGARPMEVSVERLPPGVAFDPATRLLAGALPTEGEYELTIRARNAHGEAVRPFTLVVGEAIALTPPLGWNSWNAFGPTVTGEKVRRTADLMEKLGLPDHGWAYLTIDDGWQVSAQLPKSARRTAEGEVKTNERFGDMKALADYVHARGLKIGLYSSPGPATCANYEGSWRHEFIDAKTYAAWGYDYLKYDWCTYASVATGEGLFRTQLPYALMSQALRASGRDIVHSLAHDGKAEVATWGASVGATCWRTTTDRFDFWEDVATSMARHEALWRYPRPGAWNDADMLLVGKTYWSDGRGTRLTPNEQYTHVSMWAMWASVMMIGCDLDGIDPFTLSLLTNDEVIEISQDALGQAAARVCSSGDFRTWARPLHDGSVAVALVNLSPFEAKGAVDFARIGLQGDWRVRDVWRNADEGVFGVAFAASVPGHATKLLRLFPQPGAGLRAGVRDIRDLTDAERSRTPVTTNPVAKASAETAKATSPDGRTEIRVNAGDGLTWQIVRDGRPLLDVASRLGLKFADEAEMSGFSVVSSHTARVHDTFETRFYRRGRIDLTANETALDVRASDGRRLGLVLRAYDDAVAFRYVIPGSGDYAVERELTSWAFPGNPEAWMAFYPMDDRGRLFGTSGPEERTFSKARINMIPGQGVVGVPAIVACGETRLAICEADLTDWSTLWFWTDNPRAQLRQTATLFARSPQAPGEDVVCVRGRARRVSPWRVMILSETDAGLLTRNDVIYALNPPPEGGEVAFDWVKPGVTSWDWWADRAGVAAFPTTESAIRQVDFVAEMGWPYHTIDAGWYGRPVNDSPSKRPGRHVRLEPRDGFDLPRVIAHAQSKGVGIWLWLYWNVLESPSNGLEATFAKFEKWGVKGVKIDFMERGDQEMVNWYERVVRCAAKHRLMVNFHGSYRPTGMERTWPNQITREGICGNEMNKVYGWVTPEHMATLPYTRFLIGPGDYTPGSFGNVYARDFVPQRVRERKQGTDGSRVFPKEVGTRAHALALCVAYDSPLMTLCDWPENYRGQPGIEALRALPTTWNRTIPLPDGKIGENYSVLREAHDGTWYFAAFTVEARTARLPFREMGDGDYEATVYADDPARTPTDATALRVFTRRLSHRETLEIPLCAEGGCLVKIRRQ